jgi:alkanesulfonate monooxygenase SsuD/methylene tetrahydromethanopterin reductase-like flavin-dependent oxidoreductase (luciferase family)
VLRIDVLLDPFAARWAAVRDAARAAEDLGFDGIWTWDHLAGTAHRASHVLEAWTTLSALAAITDRVELGPLVLNVANRDPGTLAVAAATMQEISGGRLQLGLGAGGGLRTPYAREQQALGRPVGGDRARRSALADTIDELRRVWADPSGVGFLQPRPNPPIVIGGFGPAMAALAGTVADGFNTQAAHPALADLVHQARSRAAERPFSVSVFCGNEPRWFRIGSAGRRRVEDLGVDRLVVIVAPPYPVATLREIASEAGLAQP